MIYFYIGLGSFLGAFLGVILGGLLNRLATKQAMKMAENMMKVANSNLNSIPHKFFTGKPDA